MNLLKATVLNGEIYICGAHFTSEPFKSHTHLSVTFKWKKDLEWERLPDTNEERRGYLAASSVAFYGCIWLMGGGMAQNGGTRVINSVEAYSPVTNSWIRKPSMNQQRAMSAAAVVNGKLFVCDGLSSEDHYLDSVEYYDPLLSRWIFCTPMPSALFQHAVVAHNSQLIVLGGLSYGPDYIGGFRANYIANVWSMDVDEANPHWTMMSEMNDGRYKHSAVIFGGSLVVIGGKTRTHWMRVGRIFDGKAWRTGIGAYPDVFLQSTSISEELAQKLLKYPAPPLLDHSALMRLYYS